MTPSHSSHIAQRVAAEQLAWWRLRGITAHQACEMLGVKPDHHWSRVEEVLCKRWRQARTAIMIRQYRDAI